jgi:hypothetical protein
MRRAAVLMLCIVSAACVREACAGRAPGGAAATPSTSERRAPAREPAPAALVDDICQPASLRRCAPPCRGDEFGNGCPSGMAQLATAEPRALIPIPGCKPGLPSTEWTSCSYTSEHVVGGALCIPLAMCAYLRANFPSPSHPAFSCSGTPGDGAQLEACDLTRCMPGVLQRVHDAASRTQWHGCFPVAGPPQAAASSRPRRLMQSMTSCPGVPSGRERAVQIALSKVNGRDHLC